VRTSEPEKLVLRRIVPFAPAVAVIAFLAGAAVGGLEAGWSAVVGIGVVTANLVATAYPLAWAARISPSAVYLVVMGGFVVRLLVVLLVMLALDATAWFSPLAFVATVVPATIVVLVAEMRLLMDRRVQAGLWYFRGEA
jgi:hypothetical protein